tara:strand:- start:82 stop:327 length:246 start_codon:yes stop_codon:yes gene_type:complete
MLFADGFEKAFVGLTIPSSNRNEVAVYDYMLCIDVLMKRDGMNEEDAIDYFYFNVVGAYVGEYTPVFINRATMEEAIDGQV